MIDWIAQDRCVSVAVFVVAASVRRSRLMVRVPLARLRGATLRALQRPRRAPAPQPAPPAKLQVPAYYLGSLATDMLV